MSQTPYPSATVVLASGGTGGHVFPARALAQRLLARNMRAVLITDRRGVDYAGFESSVDVHRISAATPSGRSLAGKALVLFAILGGIWQAIRHLRRERPIAVVGFGGYPALPTMAAARLLGIPTVLHEQNSVLGRVNKLLARHISLLALSFENTLGADAAGGRIVITGNPVRASIAAMRAAPLPQNPDNQDLAILVFGGSQGARILSQVMPNAIARLSRDERKNLHLVQQSRPEDLDQVRRAYEQLGVEALVEPFFHDMPERLAAAQLIVARAGASTVSEIAVVGRASILVPFAAAMDDHQTRNAEALAATGAAIVLSEVDFTAERVAEILTDLMRQQGVLVRMAKQAATVGRADAAERLARAVIELCGLSDGRAECQGASA